MPYSAVLHKRQTIGKAHVRPLDKTKRYNQTANSRGYNYRWQQARLNWLSDHPLCVEHMRRGEIVEGTDVDHITPHRGDKKLFWDQTNWQTLCNTCHGYKSGGEHIAASGAKDA